MVVLNFVWHAEERRIGRLGHRTCFQLVQSPLVCLCGGRLGFRIGSWWIGADVSDWAMDGVVLEFRFGLAPRRHSCGSGCRDPAMLGSESTEPQRWWGNAGSGGEQ